jgi:hypothetical protein
VTEPPEAISLEQLKQRAAALGVPMREDKWTEAHTIVNRALHALAAFDDADLRALEPSVIVRAVPSGVRAG